MSVITIPDGDDGERTPDPIDATPRLPRVFDGIGMLIKCEPKCCCLDCTCKDDWLINCCNGMRIKFKPSILVLCPQTTATIQAKSSNTE